MACLFICLCVFVSTSIYLRPHIGGKGRRCICSLPFCYVREKQPLHICTFSSFIAASHFHDSEGREREDLTLEGRAHGLLGSGQSRN